MELDRVSLGRAQNRKMELDWVEGLLDQGEQAPILARSMAR